MLYSQVIYDSCTSDDASSVASEQPIVRPPRRVRTKAEGIDLQSLANRLHCKSRRFAKRSNHCKFNYSFSLWFSFVFVYLQRFVSSMILNRRWKPEISTEVALKLNQNCCDHRHYYMPMVVTIACKSLMAQQKRKTLAYFSICFLGISKMKSTII